MPDDPSPPVPAPPPRITDRIPARRPLALVGLAAWLVPGLGHVVTGRPRRAVLMLVAVGGLFLAGLFLTAFTCVDTERYTLEFVAHVFAGGPALLTLWLAKGREVASLLPHYDVGRLYVDVAGLLNVVAISDALGFALAHNARVASLRSLAAERVARAATREAVWRAGGDPVEAPIETDPIEGGARGAEPGETGPGGDAAAEDGLPALGWEPEEGGA